MAQISNIAASANASLKTSSRGEAAIGSFEGVVLRAYPDPGTGGKPWTIGIGHTSMAGPPPVNPGMTITRDKAFEILHTDLIGFETAIKGAVKVPLQQCEFDALSSFTFNVGVGNFKSSSVLSRLNAGDRNGAANALLSWTKAAGHVLSGLVSRRNAERLMFLASSYPVGLSKAAGDNDAVIANGVLLVRGSPFADAVRALQTDLAALGFSVSVDGDFGPKTEAAVRSFQAGHNLSVDGKAGPATRSAIAAALKASGKAPVVAFHPLPGDAITAIAA